jgi:hypothetical protein
MECPICASAELRHSPGEQQLGGLRVRPDTFTCPNCGAQAEQLSNDRLRFTRVPTPYSFPIDTSLDKPVLCSGSRRTGDAAVLQLILWGMVCRFAISSRRGQKPVAVDYHLACLTRDSYLRPEQWAAHI